MRRPLALVVRCDVADYRIVRDDGICYRWGSRPWAREGRWRPWLNGVAWAGIDGLLMAADFIHSLVFG